MNWWWKFKIDLHRFRPEQNKTLQYKKLKKSKIRMNKMVIDGGEIKWIIIIIIKIGNNDEIIRLKMLFYKQISIPSLRI